MSNKNIIGIDISDFSIEAVLLSFKKGEYRVMSYSRYRLSPDIIVNGRILNKEKLKESLEKLFSLAKPQEFKANKVFLSVPESKVFSRILFLPKNIKNKELLKIAKLKAEEYIPEKTENLTSVIKILPASKNYKEILYSAVQTDIIKDLVAIFESMNMQVKGATMESISSYAGLNDEVKKKTTLLLDIGSRTTIASIFDKQGLRDTININIAGHKVSNILMEKLQISHSSAREKKRAIGLKKLDGDGRIMMAIQGQFQPLLEEIKKFINFYEESNRKRVEQVVLIGGTAQMPGINEYFKENLDLDTSIGKVFLKDIPKEAQSTKYINALGLARLAYQKKVDINFYQSSTDINWVKKNLINNFINFFTKKNLIILLGIILSIIGIYYFRENILTLLSLNEKKYNQQIIIGLEEKDDLDNYIQGLEINIPLNLERSYLDLEYEQALLLLNKDAREEVLILKNDYQEDNSYLIPYIYEEIENSIEPIEYYFNINDNLILDINYKFIIFKNKDFKDIIFSKLTEKEREKLKDWTISKTTYFLIEYKEEDKLFYLNANLVLEK